MQISFEYNDKKEYIQEKLTGQIKEIIFYDVEKENAKLKSHGKIDKGVMDYVFENCKKNYGKKMSKYLEEFEDIEFRKSTYLNYEKAIKHIESHIQKKYNTAPSLVKLFKLLKDKVSIVEIYFNKDMDISNIFKIFEKINATGKKLSEIDLIKNHLFYIHHHNFDNINKKSNDKKMCDLWADLITGTDNNLEQFFQQTISTQIKYYKKTINFINFKSTWNKFIEGKKFNEESINNPIDFLNWLKKYNLEPFRVVWFGELEKSDKIFTKIKNEKNNRIKHECEFYLKSIKLLGYKHSKDIAFIGLKQYMSGLLSGSDLVKILKNSLSFPIKYQTVSSRDSKDKIPHYEHIIKHNINSDKGNIVDYTEKTFKTAIDNINLKEHHFKESLEQMQPLEVDEKLDIFKKNTKEFTRFLNMVIDLGQSYDEDKFNKVLSRFNTKEYEVDHFIPINPRSNDESAPFTWEEKGDEKYLLIKNNDWFSTNDEKVNEEIANHLNGTTRLQKSTFISRYLNVYGNLNILSKTKNADKSNHITKEAKEVTLQGLLDKTEKKINDFLNSILFN